MIPDVLKFLLKKRDPLQAGHLLQISWEDPKWKDRFTRSTKELTSINQMDWILTHLETPLVHPRRSSVVIPVLCMVCITLLVVFMARRGRSPVTFGRSGSLQLRWVVFRGSWFGSALNNRLVLAVTAVGWRKIGKRKKMQWTGNASFPLLPGICYMMPANGLINETETHESSAGAENESVSGCHHFHPQLFLPVFLFFLGGTPRLLRFGLCFFVALPVCDSFCRFWLADATKENSEKTVRE